MNFEKVADMFQNHFVGKRNVIYERSEFHQCKQETVEAFVMTLHRLVTHCGYGALKDELVRDCLVVGWKDAKLSETLQSDPDLALETAVRKARQREAVRRQQAIVHQEILMEELSVDALRKGFDKDCSSSGDRTTEAARWNKSPHSCERCGGQGFHEGYDCPAYRFKYHSCGKKGHWQKMCRKTSLQVVTEG